MEYSPCSSGVPSFLEIMDPGCVRILDGRKAGIATEEVDVVAGQVFNSLMSPAPEMLCGLVAVPDQGSFPSLSGPTVKPSSTSCAAPS